MMIGDNDHEPCKVKDSHTLKCCIPGVKPRCNVSPNRLLAETFRSARAADGARKRWPDQRALDSGCRGIAHTRKSVSASTMNVEDVKKLTVEVWGSKTVAYSLIRPPQVRTLRYFDAAEAQNRIEGQGPGCFRKEGRPCRKARSSPSESACRNKRAGKWRFQL